MARIWWRPLGICNSAPVCRRPATGHIMNAVNAPIGQYCDACAVKLIKEERTEEQRKAYRARKKEARPVEGEPPK
jgi:hypothetical protein